MFSALFRKTRSAGKRENPPTNPPIRYALGLFLARNFSFFAREFARYSQIDEPGGSWPNFKATGGQPQGVPLRPRLVPGPHAMRHHALALGHKIVRERFVERAGNTRMGTIIIWVLGFSGYILPLPSLICGWVAWSKSRPRFNSPKWRYVSVFAGLVIASLVVLSAVFAITYLSNVRVEAQYEFAMKSCARGFVASVFALLLSLIGKGPLRFPASLGSFGLAAFWLVAAILY